MNITNTNNDCYSRIYSATGGTGSLNLQQLEESNSPLLKHENKYQMNIINKAFENFWY